MKIDTQTVNLVKKAIHQLYITQTSILIMEFTPPSKIMGVVDADADKIAISMNFVIKNETTFQKYVLNNIAPDDLDVLTDDNCVQVLPQILFEIPETNNPLPTINDGIEIQNWNYEEI